MNLSFLTISWFLRFVAIWMFLLAGLVSVVTFVPEARYLGDILLFVFAFLGMLFWVASIAIDRQPPEHWLRRPRPLLFGTMAAIIALVIVFGAIV